MQPDTTEHGPHVVGAAPLGQQPGSLTRGSTEASEMLDSGVPVASSMLSQQASFLVIREGCQVSRVPDRIVLTTRHHHTSTQVLYCVQHPWGSNRAAWHEAVQRPFEEGSPAGRARLLQLLDGCMIRAAKSGLRALPALKRTVSSGLRCALGCRSADFEAPLVGILCSLRLSQTNS